MEIFLNFAGSLFIVFNFGCLGWYIMKKNNKILNFTSLTATVFLFMSMVFGPLGTLLQSEASLYWFYLPNIIVGLILYTYLKKKGWISPDTTNNTKSKSR